MHPPCLSPIVYIFAWSATCPAAAPGIQAPKFRVLLPRPPPATLPYLSSPCLLVSVSLFLSPPPSLPRPSAAALRNTLAHLSLRCILPNCTPPTSTHRYHAHLHTLCVCVIYVHMVQCVSRNLYVLLNIRTCVHAYENVCDHVNVDVMLTTAIGVMSYVVLCCACPMPCHAMPYFAVGCWLVVSSSVRVCMCVLTCGGIHRNQQLASG
jgi:hypothetical protein